MKVSARGLRLLPCLAWFVAVAPAASQAILTIKAVSKGAAQEISLGGQVWLRLRGPGARRLAQATVARLTEALLSGPGPTDVTVRVRGAAEAELLVRGQTVLTVTAELAKLHQTSPRQLAELWAGGLRAALAQP
jgi:hypothetical protein